MGSKAWGPLREVREGGVLLIRLDQPLLPPTLSQSHALGYCKNPRRRLAFLVAKDLSLCPAGSTRLCLEIPCGRELTASKDNPVLS